MICRIVTKLRQISYNLPPVSLNINILYNRVPFVKNEKLTLVKYYFTKLYTSFGFHRYKSSPLSLSIPHSSIKVTIIISSICVYIIILYTYRKTYRNIVLLWGFAGLFFFFSQKGYWIVQVFFTQSHVVQKQKGFICYLSPRGLRGEKFHCLYPATYGFCFTWKRVQEN